MLDVAAPQQEEVRAMSRSDSELNSIAAIEDFFGEKLNEDLVMQRLMGMPVYQLEVLVERLNETYTEWVRAADNPKRNSQIFHNMTSVEPLSAIERGDGKTHGQLSKSLLAYFPGKVSVTDPVASIIFYKRRSKLPSSSSSYWRRQFVYALNALIAIRPLVNSGDAVLVPAAYLGPRTEPISELLRKQMQEAFPRLLTINRTDDFWSSVPDEWERQVVIGHLQQKNSLVTEIAVAEALGYALMATDGEAAFILDHAVQVGSAPDRTIPGAYVRFAQLLERFQIPALERISYADLARLRAEEEGFASFRSALGQILDRVQAEEPDSDDSFAVELAYWAKELLTHEVQRIDRSRRVSKSLQQFISGGAAIGTGIVTSMVTHSSPIDALAGVAAGQASWLLYPLLRRATKEGKRDTLLRTFYGSLLTDDQA
jgi:hypothetical protein